MTLPVSALPVAWRGQMAKASLHPFIHVSINLGGGDVREFISTQHRRFEDAQPVVVSASPITQRLNLNTRATTAGDWEVRFLDCLPIRRLAVNERLKGKAVTIKFGNADVHQFESELATLADNLAIEDFIPEGGTAFRMTCVNQLAYGLSDEINKYRHPGHPLDVVSQALLAGGVPSSVLGSSLDPGLYSDIGHFVISAFPYNSSDQAEAWVQVQPSQFETAMAQVRSIMEILYGTLFHGEDGPFTFTPYDKTATPVVTFDEKTIVKNSFKQQSTYKNICNGVRGTALDATSQLGEFDGSGFSPFHFFLANSADSQTDHAFPGETRRRFFKLWKNRWWGAAVFYDPGADTVVDLGNAAASHTVRMFIPRFYGFCGTTVKTGTTEIFPPTVQQPAAPYDLNGTTRVATWLITDGAGALEYVTATAMTYDTSRGFVAINSPIGEPGDPAAPRNYWRTGVFTVTRAAFGTTQRDWPTIAATGGGLFVLDITLANAKANDFIDRAAYGIPVCKFTSPLHEYSPTLGDSCRIEEPIFAMNGRDGATSSTPTFEILEKTVRILDDKPGIDWTIAVKDETALPPVTIDIDSDDVIPIGGGGPPCPVSVHLPQAGPPTTTDNVIVHVGASTDDVIVR